MAAKAAGEPAQPWAMLRRLVSFPPFVAFVLGLGLLLAGIRLTGSLEIMSQWLAAILSPLALLAVGLQLDWQPDSALNQLVGVGLFYKLLLAPALGLMILSCLRPQDLATQVCVLEAGMGPMITAALLATSHDLNPALASRMVCVGVPLSLLSVPLWWLGLSWLGG